MFPSKSSHPNTRYHHVRLLGTGAADPTKEVGHGITATRTAEGVYKLTWADNPGVFLGIVGYIFGDTTPGDVKGHTLTRDTFSAFTSSSAAYVEVSVWDSTFAANDLGATEYVDITIAFASED